MISIVPAFIKDSYSHLQYLGSGALGKTYHAVNVSNGRSVCLKEIDVHFCTQPHIDALKEELRELSELSSPHLHPISRINYDKDVQAFYIETLRCGSTLAEKLVEYRKDGGSFTEEETWSILRDICSGLLRLHSTPKKEYIGSPGGRRSPTKVHNRAQAAEVLVHGDLKLENVGLIDGATVLLDYGMTSFIEQRRDQRSVTAPSVFVAPEAVTEGACDPKNDMWAVGMVALALLKGRPVAEVRDDPAFADHLLRSGEGEESGERLRHFISLCLNINPASRISSGDALAYINEALLHNSMSGAGMPTLISSVNADMMDGIREHIGDLLTERDSRGHSALDIAIQKGNMEYVDIFVEYLERTNTCLMLGPRPHIRRVAEYTKLMKTALLNRPEYISEYIDTQANCVYGRHSMTALMIAASLGHADCVRKLISEAGVLSTRGWTALMYAVHGGHTECVKLLRVEMGVSTPSLMRACDLAKHLHRDECFALLSREADLYIGDNCRLFTTSWYNELLGSSVDSAYKRIE